MLFFRWDMNTLTNENKKQNSCYWFLIIASFTLYVILTASKNLYVAEKTTLESLGTFGTFTDLAFTMEYYFYTYAAMQIALCFFMKRLNIKWFLTLTISVSALLTILVAFTNTIKEQWILYAINGVAQAGLWGSLLKILGSYLPQNKVPVANKLMTSGPAVAGVIAYGVAALFGDNWSLPFIVMGAILLLAVAIYFIAVTKVSRYPKEVNVAAPNKKPHSIDKVLIDESNDFIHLINKKRIVVFYIISIAIGFLVTAFFFSLNNVLDIFLKQVGGFTNTTAKLITVIAPVAIIVGPFFIVNACEKHRNFLHVGFFAFAIATIFPLLLIFFFDVSIYLSLPLFLLALIFANGGRSISLSIAAFKLRSRIDTGVYSTIVNASASIASGFAPRIFTTIISNPALSIHQNWVNTFTLSACLGAFVVLFILILILWVKHLNKKDLKAAFSPINN